MPELPDWMRASAILGTDGTNYIPVLLAPDGSMYAVLQGEYAGALRTVKLDDEGRLSAFVIDSVDAWDRMLTVGNAELAARLGSPVRYDKRGQVLAVENFEHGWNRWTLYTSGTGADGEIVPTTSASGGYSVHLTGGLDINKHAYIRFQRGSLPIGRMGVEFSFAIDGAIDMVCVSTQFRTGAHEYQSIARFVYSGYDLQVLDDVAGYVSVGTGKPAGEDIHIFNTVKLVHDLGTERYARFLFNQQEIDISDRVIRKVVVTDPACVIVDIRVHSRTAYNDDAYIDDVIITVAEPE